MHARTHTHAGVGNQKFLGGKGGQRCQERAPTKLRIADVTEQEPDFNITFLGYVFCNEDIFHT